MKKISIIFFGTLIGLVIGVPSVADDLATSAQSAPPPPTVSRAASRSAAAAVAAATMPAAPQQNVVQRAAVAPAPQPSAAATPSPQVVVAPAVPTPVATTDISGEQRAASSDILDTRTAITATPRISRGAISAPRSALAAGDGSTDTLMRESATASGRETSPINASPVTRRAGVSLRPSTAEVGGRATIGNTGVQTGSNFEPGGGVRPRAATARAATDDLATMQKNADITTQCQQQYIDCMDQFCNVIDANQGRCSCSGRLATYAKVSTAVQNANDQLNEVAQRIRYVGLSADEIRAIMRATEAELALSTTTDTTQSRNMLDQIEKLIQSPAVTVTDTNRTNSLGILDDINFSSDSSILDMFNLNLGGTQSFANMRGTDLFNAAKSKCAPILTTCQKNGALISQITARYDMEIDKACIAYEQGLNKMNAALKTNVRAATTMLQKARLAVLDNNNQFDTKGCISALEQCMTDDMVCGSNYFKCVDPTKQYIDENGTVILGRNINTILQFMYNFDNSALDQAKLTTANTATTYMTSDYCVNAGNDGRCIIRYLLNKIGMGDKNTGLCRAVLDKCQAVTYSNPGNRGGQGTYMPYNEVVLNYVQRAMTQIAAAQRKIISDYAGTCMNDIAACYNQQVTQVNAWSTAASTASVYNIMKGACRNVAITCAFAVFAADQKSCPIMEQVTDRAQCNLPGNIPLPSETARPYCENVCLENISNIFFQSLLCPENSEWYQYKNSDGSAPAVGQIILVGSQPRVFVNEKCLCLPSFGYLSGRCTALGANQTINKNCTGSTPIGSATQDNCSGITNIACTGNSSPTTYGTCVTSAP